jgi:hypothetical protein
MPPEAKRSGRYTTPFKVAADEFPAFTAYTRVSAELELLELGLIELGLLELGLLELGNWLELDELIRLDELLELDELSGTEELDELFTELGVLQTRPPKLLGWLLQVVLLMQLWEFSQPQPLCVVTQLG